MGPVTVVLVQLHWLAVIGQYGRGQGRPSAGLGLTCNTTKEGTKMITLIQQPSFRKVLYFFSFCLVAMWISSQREKVVSKDDRLCEARSPANKTSIGSAVCIQCRSSETEILPQLPAIWPK